MLYFGSLNQPLGKMSIRIDPFLSSLTTDQPWRNTGKPFKFAQSAKISCWKKNDLKIWIAREKSIEKEFSLNLNFVGPLKIIDKVNLVRFSNAKVLKIPRITY